jgi:hypothetical protein
VIGHFEYGADAAETYNRAARGEFSEFAYCNDTGDWKNMISELALEKIAALERCHFRRSRLEWHNCQL